MSGQLGSIWWGLILLGLGAGILSGTLGLGSGTILIPVLVLIFCFPQKSAQGTALMVMVPMAAMGALLYWRHPEIEVPVGAAALIVAGALVGSVIGAKLATHVPGHVLRKVFAVYLLLIAAKILILSPGKRPPAAETAPREQAAALIEKGSAGDDIINSPDG